MSGRGGTADDAERGAARSCPTCGEDGPVARFDVAVRREEGGERHFFGLLAMLCRSCGRFLLDPDAVTLYGIGELDIASAIMTDRYLRLISGAGPA
ncbi:MAG TPA: hypothetical protein VEY67_11800 [Candidatus Dormibacteraeota bacterium]|nr:hypothetical protein [Candidatus Dormibacteraeota bacterium]